MAFVANDPGFRLNYNGVEFGSYTATTEFGFEPVKDSSGRTVAFYQYKASFKSYITTSLNPLLVPQVRAALGKNGGAFIMTGRSWGDYYVNVGGRVRDVMNGPWVTRVSMRDFGSLEVTEISWSIEWSVPECRDARFIGVPMEFAYSLTFAIDEFGFSVRTMSGRVKIPQNRLTPLSRTPQDSADLYLEDVLPVPLKNFRRTIPTRELNEDRSELKFTVVDAELDCPAPPPGVVKEEGSVELNSENMLGSIWSGSISYQCELAKNGKYADALKGAQSFVFGKMDQLKKSQVFGEGVGADKAFIPVSWKIAEPTALGRKRFSFSLNFSMGSKLANLLAYGGWFQVPSDTAKAERGNWDKWYDSLADSATNTRGYARLSFDPAEDKIVDLCGYEKTPPGQGGIDNALDRDNPLAGLFDPVPPEQSWLYFRNELNRETVSGVVATNKLPKKPLTDKTDVEGKVDATKFTEAAVDTGAFAFPSSLANAIAATAGNTGAERVRRPRVEVVMTGEALRVGYTVPEPTLTKLFGIEMIPANDPRKGDGFKQIIAGHNGIQPFYYARWQLRYLPKSDLPTDVPMPQLPNPVMNPNGVVNGGVVAGFQGAQGAQGGGIKVQ